MPNLLSVSFFSKESNDHLGSQVYKPTNAGINLKFVFSIWVSQFMTPGLNCFSGKRQWCDKGVVTDPNQIVSMEHALQTVM